MKASNSVLSAVVVSVLGLSATLNAPQALALDGKNYPGYMCKQWNGTGWVQTGYSSIYNGAAGKADGNDVEPNGWAYLDCPVIKDVIDSSISSGWVQVTDRHFSRDIQCRLWSMSRNLNDSTISFWMQSASSSGTSPGVKTLNFAPLPAISYAHYFYDCAIPPTYLSNPANASEIHTYSVNENGNG